jgi:hypothetical protein
MSNQSAPTARFRKVVEDELEKVFEAARAQGRDEGLEMAAKVIEKLFDSTVQPDGWKKPVHWTTAVFEDTTEATKDYTVNVVRALKGTK